MKEIKIYEFQAKIIANALRLAIRALNSKELETSMDRDIMQAKQYIDNALQGNIDIQVNRYKP